MLSDFEKKQIVDYNNIGMSVLRMADKIKCSKIVAIFNTNLISLLFCYGEEFYILPCPIFLV